MTTKCYLKTLVTAAALAFSAGALAGPWTVVPETSSVGFVGTQQGTKFNGRFQTFTAQINLDAADPTKGLDAAIKAVPELGSKRDTQLAILNATIATWAPPGGDRTKYGIIDRDGWQASIEYLTRLGLVPKPVTVDGLVRELGSSPVP